MRPVPHIVELPVPKPPTNMTESSDEDVGEANNIVNCDPTFAGASTSNEQHPLTKGGLNDIIHGLNLSKKQAELLRFQVKGLESNTLKCVFTVGTMKNSRISLPGKWCHVLQ